MLTAANLSSGFNDFIAQAENKHLAETQQQLITLYQQNNSWQPIINNEQVWRDIANPASKRPPPRNSAKDYRKPKPRNERPRKEHNNHRKQSHDATNPSEFLQTGKRLSLYDKNKKVIVGKRNLADNPHTVAIEMNGEIIGWLGLKSSKFTDNSENEFLTQQYENYYLIASVAISLAFIMALIFSQHLIAPIKRLINGTNRLIEGKYQNRINKTTQDEIGVLSNNVNILAETLEKNQKNRFQWMSDTSHELRTPLTVLRAQLTAIQDGIFAADKQRVQLLVDEVDTLSHLVNDLYQLSSSDAGGLTYQKVSLNPIAILMNVIENFTAKFEQSSITIDYLSLESLLNDNRCIMLADKERLRQLFANLLENCCRYTHGPGKITVSSHYNRQVLNIIIEDSAPGVPRESQEKLFERFYRVEQSRNRNHGGSGLGLALCKQIVEAHQGTITAFDSLLGGLCIKMTFPTQKKPAE